jgi:cell division septum initiation protein DivIVA
MSDQSLRRADELLTDLVEIVETARALPMSSSCVVPREQVLDLLDSLREVMPPEMAQARSLVARRDAVQAQAQEQADQILAEARAEGDRVVYAARTQAHQMIEAAHAEQSALLSASSVHQRAEIEAQAMRAEAEAYVDGLRRNGESYADRTLADLVELLNQASRTAENGRRALAQRIAAADSEAGEAPDGPADEAHDHDLDDASGPSDGLDEASAAPTGHDGQAPIGYVASA